MASGSRRQLLVLGLLGGCVLAASLLLSPLAVLRRVEALAAHPAALAAVLGLLYLSRPLVALPVSALSAFVGYLLGPVVGLPVALLGATVTCLPPYLLARWFQRPAPTVARLGDAGARAVDATGPVRGVLAARLAPVPADAVSYGAGLSGVAPGAYVAGTLLGEVPWTVAAVLAGDSMRTITVDGLSGAGLSLAAGLAGVAVLLLAGPTYRHLRARRARASPP